MYRTKLGLLFCLLLGFNFISAQSFKLDNTQSNLTVNGTSNLHDWNIKADVLTGRGVFFIKSGVLKTISELTFTVVVKKLKSEKKEMNKKILDALNAQEFKTIDYQFKKLGKIKAVDKHTFIANTSGLLTIAGVSKLIDLQLTFNILNKGIIITGVKNLKMTDFNINPPKALLGMLKTSNDISVLFNAFYQ